MEVYIELAFAENFALDALLVFLALKCARGKVRPVRLLLAASIGAVEAILFPLLPLPVWASYLIKLLGGLLIILLAVSKGTKKTYLVAIAAFFALTFALGGMLTALYSFFDIPYLEGTGYIVEKVPIGLMLGGAGLFGIAVYFLATGLYRYRKVQRSLFPVVLCHDGKTLNMRGFADSGNMLTYKGEPVCVLSPAAALALFRGERERAGVIHVQTVHGGRDAPLFRCQRMELGGTGFSGVLFTVGETSKDYQIILHTNFVEGAHESDRHAEVAVTKDPR